MMKQNRKANEVDFQKDGTAVGSGNTINFIGSGVSAVSVSGDVATVHIAGGAGNPVTSGILTSSNNTLRLTLQDASTVDVDVTSLNSVSPVSLANSTAYFFFE